MSESGCEEDGVTRCPSCGSPDPKLHPATQHEGEVMSICKNEFHGQVPQPENEPKVVKEEGDEEALSDDQLRSMISSLQAANKGLLNYMKSHGAEPTEVAGTRHEMFIQMLAETGMVPPQFMLAFEARWEQYFNEILKNMRKQVDDKKAAEDSEMARRVLLHGVPGVTSVKRHHP